MYFDLAPKAGNPRNSEGSFLRLNDGRIAFAYSRYSGSSADDHAYAEIACIFSSDNGETFGNERILVRPNPDPAANETNCMSVTLMRMANGDVGLFYLLKRNHIVSEYLLRRSADEMETFGEPVVCVASDMPGYYVVNNDRVIRMAGGRLLLPAAHHPSAMGLYGRDACDGRATAGFYASDDDGFTWRRISNWISLGSGAYSGTGMQEPGLVELTPGVLYAYFRTDLGRQYESLSVDGGASWTPVQPSRFTSPASPLLIKRNEFTGKLYAIWNPVPEYYGRPRAKVWNGGRTPLVIAEGEFGAGGIRWGAPRVIEDDPEGGFCYPAILFTGERTAVMSYCAGGVVDGDEMCLVRTRIRTIEL